MKATVAIYGIKDRRISEVPSYVHDHNICIMQDGKILRYLQLERYSRRKYDNRLDLFLEELVERKLINLPEEFDLICVNDFVGNSFISMDGKIRFEANKQKILKFEAIPGDAYYQYEEWNGKEINAFLCQHEVAHICSSLPFYESVEGGFNDNSLLVSIDGGSSLGNYSAFLFKDGKFKLIENNWEALGFASKLFNDNSLSFKMLGAGPGSHCSVPGKLMGFASWGTYDPKIEKWLRDNNYFKEYWNREEEILKSIADNFGVKAEFKTEDPFMQNIAATMQRIFEKAIISKIQELKQKYGCDYLYYGGGCALNIVTNTKLYESHFFKQIFVAPCCNDSGLSIGAACLLELQKGNIIKLHSPYLNNVQIDETSIELDDKEIHKIAELIKRGGIVGISNGVAEVGPRALGNRSLVARPDNKDISKRLSMEVKKREWYRPVAPIMLKEIAKKVSDEAIGEASKYMLMDFHIKKEFHNVLEGVVHANGTARIQTLENEKENPFMYRLLKFLAEEGILALTNTSFNAAGEPLVHTIEQAKESAKKMNLDGLVINGKLLVRGEY
ncbi:MAG: carbamoyltransferase C-terminal domain-containing protein [Treponema sp.]